MSNQQWNPQQGWGQQQPQWGGQPPQQPKKSNAGKAVGLGCLGVVGLLVVIGVIGAVASGGDDDGGKGASSKASAVSEPAAGAPEKEAAEEAPDGPEGDVKITGCEVSSATGWPRADVLITNRSSKQSNYIVSVEFVDGTGKRLGEAFAATNNVAAGQEVEEDAQSLDKVEGEIKCRVTKVTRYAS
ncbi:FxLYD domain-containing protein [Streptomyces globisporus]|uniref:FxLYD domain-containing protein n=1 Tax=Streptomyces globisporus TaxID=1908 RepID=UPI0036DB1282